MGSSPTVGTTLDWKRMTDADFFDENCENCKFLTVDDTCGNPESVYYGRPMVYRDEGEVLQTGWCDRWEPVTPQSSGAGL